jgi:hypothetical protein
MIDVIAPASSKKRTRTVCEICKKTGHLTKNCPLLREGLETKTLVGGQYLIGTNPSEILDKGRIIYLEFGRKNHKDKFQKSIKNFDIAINSILCSCLKFTYEYFLETYYNLYVFVVTHKTENQDVVVERANNALEDPEVLDYLCIAGKLGAHLVRDYLCIAGKLGAHLFRDYLYCWYHFTYGIPKKPITHQKITPKWIQEFMVKKEEYFIQKCKSFGLVKKEIC